MSQNNETIYRTTSARTGKMMAIMLGICIVGGAIFFSMWDFWISSPAPVVAMKSGLEQEHGLPKGVATGKHIDVQLKFIESSDFRNLAFNALPGEEGHNPTIQANVGDEVAFSVENAGKSSGLFRKSL